MGLAGSNAARALADRKGATSLEYAMIAAGIAATVMVGFQAFYTRVSDFVAGLQF